MAAAAAESSWMPALVGPQRVEIGSSLRRALKARSGTAQDGALDQRSKRLPDNDYYSFRYRFRPATVDPHKTGTLEHREGDPQYTLLRPSEKGDNVVFTGAERAAKEWDCVLIYDEVTGALSLEKIDSHFDWAHHRGATASAAAASTNGAAAQHHSNGNSNTLALPLAAAAPKAGPSRAQAHSDAQLVAELERDLQDADASGESDHDFEPVAIPARGAKASYASFPTEETFDLSAPAPPPAPRPGKGKGVARVEAAAAAKAKPRGKKRKSTAEDDEFEVVPAPGPPPARPAKRKKPSPPPPPPPPPVALALPPRPAELLVPPPARAPPDYTSSEDEADMLEEVHIPPLANGDAHANEPLQQLEDDEFIEIDPSGDLNLERDIFGDMEDVEEEPQQQVPEADEELVEVEELNDEDLADDIFGGMEDAGGIEDADDMEEATYGEDVPVNGNGYTNGHTNGHDPAAPLYPTYVDTSSDDSDDSDDD